MLLVSGNLLSVCVRTHRKTVHHAALILPFPRNTDVADSHFVARCDRSVRTKYRPAVLFGNGIETVKNGSTWYVPNHNQHDAEPQIPVKSPPGIETLARSCRPFRCSVPALYQSNVNGSSDRQQQQTLYWGRGDRCLQQGHKPPGSGVWRKTCEPPGINVIDFIQTA